MFTHNFVERKRLKQKNIDGKRYYILPDGITTLKSVTTVISEKKDNSGLYKWRQRVGNTEANRISGIATSRGTSIHKMAENFLLNKNYITEKTMPSNIESFDPLKRTLEKHVNNIRGIELPLYSTYLQAAGTGDLIADYDNEISIIDHKTSKKLKKEEWIEDYFIQLTTYALMFRGMYDIPIHRIVVLMTVDGISETQIYIRRVKDYIPLVLEYFTQ